MFIATKLRIVAFIVAVASVATAAPATPSPDAADSDGNVFFCTDDNFGGSCLLFAFNNNQCNNVPSGFNDDISSFGPDAGIGCVVFSDFNCGGVSLGVIHNPGISDLSQFGFQDTISSFECAVGQ